MTVRTITVDCDLPVLVVPWPECSHCGETVEIEDGAASCPRCLIQFDGYADGDQGRPDPNLEGTSVPCLIESGDKPLYPPHTDANGRRYVPGAFKPCILPSSHEGEHIWPYDVEVTE